MTDWFMTATQPLGLCWFWLYPRLRSQCIWKLVVCLLWPLRCRAGLGLLYVSALWLLPTPGCVALSCSTPVLVRQTHISAGHLLPGDSFSRWGRTVASWEMWALTMLLFLLPLDGDSGTYSLLPGGLIKHICFGSQVSTLDRHLPTFLTRIPFYAPHKSYLELYCGDVLCAADQGRVAAAWTPRLVDPAPTQVKGFKRK